MKSNLQKRRTHIKRDLGGERVKRDLRIWKMTYTYEIKPAKEAYIYKKRPWRRQGEKRPTKKAYKYEIKSAKEAYIYEKRPTRQAYICGK